MKLNPLQVRSIAVGTFRDAIADVSFGEQVTFAVFFDAGSWVYEWRMNLPSGAYRESARLNEDATAEEVRGRVRELAKSVRTAWTPAGAARAALLESVEVETANG